MAAINTFPTDIAIRSAMIISMILGGIRIPSVPDAAMTPVDKAWLYPWRIIVGRARAVIIVTEAPIMPVIAASIVPITVTASANAPGTFLRRTCTQYRRSFAIPLRSSITPM